MPSFIRLEVGGFLRYVPEIGKYWAESEPENYRAKALVIPGFIGLEPHYTPFRHFLRGLGVHTSFYSRGYNPRQQITRPVERFREEIEEVVDAKGPFDYVIGHSTGAVEALIMLAQYQDIKRVFAIRPGFDLGISRSMMRLFKFIDVVPHALVGDDRKSILEDAEPHQRRLTTISVRGDWLTLPGGAGFLLPQARNHIVNVPEEQEEWTPHGDINLQDIQTIVKQEMRLKLPS